MYHTIRNQNLSLWTMTKILVRLESQKPTPELNHRVDRLKRDGRTRGAHPSLSALTALAGISFPPFLTLSQFYFQILYPKGKIVFLSLNTSGSDHLEKHTPHRLMAPPHKTAPYLRCQSLVQASRT